MNLFTKIWRGVRRRIKTRRIVETIYEPAKVLDNQLLAGRTALVTGAAANIGRATVIEMAKQGASVIAIDLDGDGLQKLKAAVPENTRIETFLVDVGSEQEIDKLCGDLDAADIHVDILINNVGIHTELQKAWEGDFDEWRRGFEVNLFGPFRLTQNIASRLEERGKPGSIVFISSIHQWHIRGHPSYSASKAGIGLLIKELADRYANSDIRVNGIAPAATMPEKDGKPVVLEHVPLRGVAIPPQYIGRNAVVLASDYFSRHTTGSVLLIDAGLLARGFLTRLPRQRAR
jgi:NAD(P)-dependent dehydrogenase (short-subunit alcohol dehydrogenase family)